jgi:hypothetical protein
MLGGENDEAISIYAFTAAGGRIASSSLPPLSHTAVTPRNDNSEVFQQSRELASISGESDAAGIAVD